MQNSTSGLQPAPAAGNQSESEIDYGITRDPATITKGMVAVFRELFVTDDTGPDDDFFTLGGDSTLAVSLMSAIERDFTSILPVSVLLEATTPRELAAKIVDDLNYVAPSNIVPVRVEGAGNPVFCIHGMDGDALFSRRLPPVLSPARPVYGLRASGLHGDERPVFNVPSIASSYVADIKSVQPSGPYIILGQCGCSVIAIEMVRQMQAAGDEIAGLILMDPAVSDYVPWLSTTGMQRALLQAKSAERGRLVQERMEAMPNASGVDRRKMVSRSLSSAIGTYTPQRVDVEGLILCSPGRVKRLMNSVRGYPSLVSRLESHVIEGDHIEMFAQVFRGRPARLHESAALINAFLARVAPVGQAGAA